ncbi:MAG: tRNA pseudouridine(38-40) synthase TruA [Eubacterium sp.]|nr:tRNA pseudouridine(38-40) synthase TruA [Eubacterium sp.]
MKQNFKMTVSYDGSRYYGWEHQPGTDMTIQGKLERVLERMTDDTQKVTVIGAGRTDAGVHALAMTANFILDTDFSEDQIRDYMNRYLPDDISVRDLKICADRFHSRFKAKGKTYRYTFYIGKDKPVFDRKYVACLERMPDVASMRKAAELLQGMHDFKSFCGNSHMKKSTVRLVDKIEISHKGSYLYLTFHGSGFLQNMVRIMTGTLLEVGQGKRKPEDMTEILDALDRKAAGPTAPAAGLTLICVDY